ncbi:hypothetical protein ACHAWF_004117 [Thalassiosira exigua]
MASAAAAPAAVDSAPIPSSGSGGSNLPPVDEGQQLTDADAALTPHDDDDHDDEEEDDEPEVKEWDEGGKSHCGYGDSVHEVLMSIGEAMHKVVGEPTDGVQGAMKSVGNWFQEASYAARDLQRGKMDVAEETKAAMKSVVSGDEEDNKEGDGEGGEGASPVPSPTSGSNEEGDKAKEGEAAKPAA